MNINKKRLKEIYSKNTFFINTANKYIGEKSQIAYKNVYNLSNPVLSRSPYGSSFFKKLLFQEEISSLSKTLIIKQFLLYYRNSFRLFISHIIRHYLFIKSCFRCKTDVIDSTEDLYIIDVFLLVEKIVSDGYFEDSYFEGLYPVLNKYKKKYLILPTFIYGENDWEKINKLFHILKNENNNFITEFELLTFTDYIRIIKFIIIYPFNIFKINPTEKHCLDSLFKTELVNTLGNSQFQNYIKYLVGKRLTAITNNKLILISWFENQVIDKNLYRGLRDFKENVLIYGCQTCIYCPTQMNFKVIKSEFDSHISPDIILVNGEYYMMENNKLPDIEYRLGPSLRYKNIFKNKVAWENKHRCLVLLSYLTKDSEDIIRLSRNSRFATQPVLVKPHPANLESMIQRISKLLPQNWSMTDDNVYELFHDTRLIITSESGTAVEAVAMGITVIILANQSSFTSNPLCELGKGKIWEIAYDSEELNEISEKLLLFRRTNRDELRQIANQYKKLFFTEPHEECIVKAFDL